MKKQKQFYVKYLSSSIILILASGIGVFAEEADTQEKGFRCFQNEKEIFRSECTDISVFDAESRGLQQTVVQDHPDKGVRVYIFEPGPVICALKTN